MNFDINDTLIHQKMDEYLAWLRKTGIVTNQVLLNQFSKHLHSINIRRIYNAPGDAHITGNKLEYCSERIVGNMVLHGTYYLDEVLFHEFTHLLNAFNKAIRGPKSFMIGDAIEKKMGCFTNSKLLAASDSLLYNQDPCFGVILIDEYVAQSVAQIIVRQKYNALDNNSKLKYSRDRLSSYNPRPYTTKVCNPPLTISTSLADYPEFDILAKYFIKKYHLGTEMDVIKNSFDENYLRNIIFNLDFETAEEMYVDLCYMGLIEQRVAIQRGFITSDNSKDPVNYPKAIYQAFQRLLKK